MDTDNYIKLIYRRLKGPLSSDETKALQAWLEQSSKHKKIEQSILQSWQLLDDFEPPFEVDVDADFEKIRTKMKPSAKRVALHPRRKWIGIAAAVTLLLTITYTSDLFRKPVVQIAQTGVNEILEVQLADGSIVWLNENSSLEHPDFFKGKERNVTLKGEAFFDVKRNENKPFRIETRDAEVLVLGTSFNVKTLEGESLAEVTVHTGKVQFASNNGMQKTILEQGQAAQLNVATNEMFFIEEASMNSIAWKTKQLSFRNMMLSEVFHELGQYFDQKFEIGNAEILDCPFTMPPKEADLQKILNDITQIFNLSIEQRDDTLVVKGGGC